MSDGPGRIFFTSGNGVSPAPGPGSSPPGQLAESTVRLRPRSNGSLAAQGFFSPANAPTLDASDIDFGSGGPVGVPFGTATYPDVLVQAGKDGRVFMLNRDNLGGREQGAGGVLTVVVLDRVAHRLDRPSQAAGDATAYFRERAAADARQAPGPPQ